MDDMSDLLDGLNGGLKGQERLKDKADRATTDQVLDDRTRAMIQKLINRGAIDAIHGSISTGKEANVYLSSAPGDTWRAVKVYRTTIMAFKDREEYVTGDHRFQSRAAKSSADKVKQWAEKEFRNLKRIHSKGIPCPEPIELVGHNLVMGFLGDKKGRAYPKLLKANIPAEESEQIWQQLYVQALGIMRRLYQLCRLVHGDLSEYNILYHDQQLYLLDVSQSVEPDHPKAFEFLRRDIMNTANFFRKQGADTLPDRTVFEFILKPTGSLHEPELTQEIETLYSQRPASDERDAAQEEIDTEVFRNQYIPQTLEQVYDIEKDADQMNQGDMDLVHKTLLADPVAKDTDESSEDDSLEDRSQSGNRPPQRLKRFEDKETKKQRKRESKEARQEQLKTKMPKYLKKRMIEETKRKKKK
ncbi:RIO1 family-domain-containing protein [Xylariaceae sp. FL0804]|nr:RIO1 family-domain-containing protein [Xylariaceae sp. FL0804]